MTGRSLDDFRAVPPSGEPERLCPTHPGERSVYVAIPIRTLEDTPATVRGWTCPRCWTPRSVVGDLRLDDDGRRG